MHEYGLVQVLLERAEAEARARGATRVVRVHVAIGERAGVEPELLGRAWDTFRERTVCEGAPLELRSVPVAWDCPRCSAPIAPGSVLRCPSCGVPARMASGGDLILERLELEVPDV